MKNPEQQNPSLIRRIVVRGGLTLATLGLATSLNGCVDGTPINPPVAIESLSPETPEFTPDEAASTKEPAPAKTPEATPTPIPTPEVPLTPEELQLDQNIKDFLNGEGEFTQEKINSQLYANGTSETTKLGIIYARDRDDGAGRRKILLQGDFLGYIETADQIKVAVGLQDKNDDQFVTLLYINTKMYRDLGNDFCIDLLKDRKCPTNVHDFENILYKYQEITNQLKKFPGKVVLFELLTGSIDLYPTDEIKQQFAASAEAIYDLYTETWVSEQAQSAYGYKADSLADKNGIFVTKINSVQEIKNNNDNIPMVGTLYLYL